MVGACGHVVAMPLFPAVDLFNGPGNEGYIYDGGKAGHMSISLGLIELPYYSLSVYAIHHHPNPTPRV